MTNDQIISALSWEISTKPNLYRELAVNPYSPASQELGLKKFPHSTLSDLTKAVILAEPLSTYDRNFKKLTKSLQTAKVIEQNQLTTEITNHLNDYYKDHNKEFFDLSEDLIYGLLYKLAFGTSNYQLVEQTFPQNQRIAIKLLILDYVVLLKDSSNHGVAAITAKSDLIVDQPVVIHRSRKIVYRTVLLTVSSVAFFSLIFLLTNSNLSKTGVKFGDFGSNQSIQDPKTNPYSVLRTIGFPVRLKIPSIEVDSNIEYKGLTDQAEMEVPSNTTDVGWYKFGPRPGEVGSAVISGHFDGRKGEAAVFNNLDKLKAGDQIYIVNNLGITTTFLVRESRIYKPGFAEEVFITNDGGKHLNLITCDGVWNESEKSYSKRLVVFADGV